MDEPHEGPAGMPLNERLLDLLVYLPAGIAASVMDDFPALAERGRQKLGVRVSSARAIGQFAVRAGQDELRRRSEALRNRTATTTPAGRADDRPVPGPSGAAGAGPGIPGDAGRAFVDGGSVGAAGPRSPVRPAPPTAGGNIPAASTLSIPGFDTLSASQVVQRLDGLNRSELVSVRVYEASTRGRRTILSRVDRLLDERS